MPVHAVSCYVVVCADIDVSACQRLAAIKKDLCGDDCVVKACPATCGKCCEYGSNMYASRS